MPQAASAKNRMPARPTPPMASGPSGPTISVSTMPIAIQPISARITGQARRPSGRSSLRHEAAMRGVVGTAVDIRRSYRRDRRGRRRPRVRARPARDQRPVAISQIQLVARTATAPMRTRRAPAADTVGRKRGSRSARTAAA